MCRKFELIWIIGTCISFQLGVCLHMGNKLYHQQKTIQSSSKYHLLEVLDEVGNIVLLNVTQHELPVSSFSIRTYDGEYETPFNIQRRNDCYLTGSVLNVSDTHVSINRCNDFSGFMLHENKLYNVESGRLSLVRETNHKEGHQKDKPVCNQTRIKVNGTSHENLRKKHHRIRRSTETLMIELYVVTDKDLFIKPGIDKNVSKALKYIEDVVRLTDEIYSSHGIRVLLVGVDIWRSQNPAITAPDATELLDQFLEVSKQSIRSSASVEYDFIALISGKNFGNNHVGMAHVDSMCGDQSGAIVQDDQNSITRELNSAVILAHEIGHVFGMLHDDAGCTCLSVRNCLMNADITQLPIEFSSCSGQDIKEIKETGRAPCLYNVPDKVYRGPICGNGIKEKGEICDCGGTQKCKSSQCCTDTCQLKPGAKCNIGACCHNCQYVKRDKLCRRAQNQCDLDEVCDGRNEMCPPNLYKQDLLSCGQGLDKGYCYRGQCRSNTLQCQYIWGDNGTAADTQCYIMNKRGNEAGNCGSLPNGSYLRCNDTNMMCGMVFCDSPTQQPIIGGGTQTISVTNISPFTCKGVALDLGPDVPDPGIVDDGSPCFTDRVAQTKGVCIDRNCIDIRRLPVKQCPLDVNGTTCSDHGICNNLGNCWCHHGYTGTDCSVEIIIPVLIPNKELSDLHIILIAVGCFLFVSGCLFVVIFICCKKKMKAGMKKEKDKGKNGQKDQNIPIKNAWTGQTDKENKKKTLRSKSTKVNPISSKL